MHYDSAYAIYRSNLQEEKDWEIKQENIHDIIVRNNLLQEIRQLGYEYYYLVDITNRQINDERILDIILKYIGKFEDEDISAELIGVFAEKNI